MAEYRTRWNKDIAPWVEKLRELDTQEQIKAIKKGLQDVKSGTSIKPKPIDEKDDGNGNKEIVYSGVDRIVDVYDMAEMLGINLENHTYDFQEPSYYDQAMSLKDDDGKKVPASIRNWRLKVKFKKLQSAEDEDFIKQEVFEELKKSSPSVPLKHKKKVSDDYNGVILEINIPDLHLGKLSNIDEVGENYDLKIAKKIYENTIDKFIERSKHLNIKEIWLVIGSDFFNVDTIYNTTTKGTPQDEDTRWQKTFKIGVNLMKEQIQKLSNIAPVKGIVVPGNHDKSRSYYLGSVLEAYFENDKNVEIDNSPNVRKYKTFGDCAVLFAHGDKIKNSEWSLLFASEDGKTWGDAKYREVHLGDKHHMDVKQKNIRINEHERAKEYKGAVVRIIRSLSSLDEYHYTSGYVGTIKGAEAFVWKSDEGIIQTIAVNL